MSEPARPQRVLIVGASLAGVRTAESLRTLGFDGEIVLAGDEPHRPYDRPPLSKDYLGGARQPADLRLDATLPDDAVRWRLGAAATALDPARRVVSFADGGEETYDRLVLACGTTPIVPPGLDVGLGGVHLLRTLDDADGLRADLDAGPRHVVVLGAGFIGAELASTCRARGLAVTLVDAAPLPLSRPLGPEVAQHLLDLHRADGVDFRLGVAAEAFTAEGGRVTGLRLADGGHLAADLVVVAIGVRPATAWLADSGLALDDGVVCAPDLASLSHPDVYAVGDVVRFEHPLVGAPVRVEHWSNAVEGASVVAEAILGGQPRHHAVPSFWTDQLGVKIQGVGFTAWADEVEVEDDAGALVATYRREGRTIGAVAFGRPRRLIAVRRELAAALVG